MQKEVGIIGLGKMGGNIARRLSKMGWKVVGFNRTETVTQELVKEGIIGAYSLSELTEKLTSSPKVILLILPAGEATENMLFGEENILKHLTSGDIVIDGANSFYKDTIERYSKIKPTGIQFIDAGISGGPGGALNGACLMVGGEKDVFDHLQPLFANMAQENALMHFEGVGAGHFVKMVHNGIEYGMMQSIAEGFTVLKDSPFNLDLVKVTEIYNNGSVVESRLVGWLQDAYKKYGQDLGNLSGAVGFNGEGEWTANVAHEMGIPAQAIEGAVTFRKESQENPSYTGKVLTGMRNSFGGHSIEKGKMT
jgi:6-phosphogluconate dehydrogenase